MNDERLREAYAAALRAGAAGRRHPCIARGDRRAGPPRGRRVGATRDTRSCDELPGVSGRVRSAPSGRAGGRPGRRAARVRTRRAWLVPAALAASLLVAVGVGRMVTTPGGDDISRGDAAPLTLLVPGPGAVAGSPVTFVVEPGAGRSQAMPSRCSMPGGGVVLSGRNDRYRGHARARPADCRPETTSGGCARPRPTPGRCAHPCGPSASRRSNPPAAGLAPPPASSPGRPAAAPARGAGP